MRRQILIYCGLATLVAPCLPAAAATLTVTDLGDAGNGVCAATCTLRDAIAGAASGDSIVFDAALTWPATITLAGQELFVYKDLTILGPGADRLTIDAGQKSRILEIAANASASVSGIEMNNGKIFGGNGANGNLPRAPDGGDAYGGGVLVDAGSSLQLIACRLNGNQAAGGFGGTSNQIYSRQGNGGSAHGGAVYSAGTLSMKGCSVTGSLAFGGAPGGFLRGTSNTIPGNGGSATGGAIEATGLTEIADSQFLNNSVQATSGGQGVGGYSAGGNGGDALGGALAFSGFAALSNVTSLGGSVGAGYGGSGSPNGSSGLVAGADIYSNATVLSRYTALTSTSGASTCAVATIVAQGANFDADSSCANFTLHGDAKLQVVTSGGDTFAFPLWGSPLIDVAADCKDAFGATLDNDVRGETRPLDGNADGIAACDIGAVESDELFANGFE